MREKKEEDGRAGVGGEKEGRGRVGRTRAHLVEAADADAGHHVVVVVDHVHLERRR